MPLHLLDEVNCTDTKFSQFQPIFPEASNFNLILILMFEYMSKSLSLTICEPSHVCLKSVLVKIPTYTDAASRNLRAIQRPNPSSGWE